ncbi:MAG TPA: DinB family protein [Candidatus Acidoferrum sp.]|jgi:uncharacterized damage-inducible protein DinB
MKRILLLAMLLLPFSVQAQTEKPATLRSILLDQLRTTHDKEDWFVPVNIAVEGVTPEQASWTDGKGNHSIGQLANHIVFWNLRQLQKFKGETQIKYNGNNDETFNSFDSKSWSTVVKQLDEVMKEWEKVVETADDKKLQEWAPVIARIGTHNAYHTGQIIYVRKLQGIWDPAKGVK